MNVDIRVLFADGERAARAGAHGTARACFLEAARTAIDVQLWRSALRCYRHALELDLLDREVLAAIARLPPRVIAGRGWDEYGKAVATHPGWPSFGCRAAQVRIGNDAATIDCPGVGAVLDVLMSERDLVEMRPVPAFVGMPIAMALIIARRALWPAPRGQATEPRTIRVAFEGHQRVRLDEHGDWDPIVGAP